MKRDRIRPNFLYVKHIDISPLNVNQEATWRVIKIALTEEQKALLSFQPPNEWLRAISLQED